MSRNDITNDLIASGPDGTEAQDKYAKGWEAIFGKKKEAGFSKSQQAILDDDEPCIMGGGCYGPSMSFDAWESQPKYKIKDILADPTHHAYKATLEILELLERGEIVLS